MPSNILNLGDVVRICFCSSAVLLMTMLWFLVNLEPPCEVDLGFNLYSVDNSFLFALRVRSFSF